MDYFITPLASIIASYLSYSDIKKLNLIDLIRENDWKDMILSTYASIVDDINSKGDFNTWKDFYLYLDHIVNSRANLLKCRTDEISKINLKSTKSSIPFNELHIYFYPHVVPLIKTFKEGDVIQLDTEDYMLVEKENGILHLTYKTQFNPDEFGLRNIRIHNFKPIYYFPIRYWSIPGLDKFNIFSLALNSQSSYKIHNSNSLIITHNNVKYNVIFKNVHSLINFTKYKMPIMFKPTQYKDNISQATILIETS